MELLIKLIEKKELTNVINLIMLLNEIKQVCKQKKTL